MAVYRLLSNSDGNGWENTVYSAILKGSFSKYAKKQRERKEKQYAQGNVFTNYIEIYNYGIVNVVRNNESKSKGVHCENLI